MFSSYSPSCAFPLYIKYEGTEGKYVRKNIEMENNARQRAGWKSQEKNAEGGRMKNPLSLRGEFRRFLLLVGFKC